MVTQATKHDARIDVGVDWRVRACTNEVLAQVSSEVLGQLLDVADLIPLRRGDRIDYLLTRERVVFPLSGLLGGVIETEEGDCVQPVCVGAWGVLGGMRAVHGMPFFLLYKVRLPGEAIVVPSSVVRSIAAASPRLQIALSRASARKFRLAANNALCARFHSLSTRCCAWLAFIHHEADGDVIPITHEELAEVVGATRPAVSAALSPLTHDGLIASMGRGAIRVIDPAAIARRACDCWVTPNGIAPDRDVYGDL